MENGFITKYYVGEIEMTREDVLKVLPTANRVVVKETRETKVGSIILAESSQTKNTFAEVIAIGPDVAAIKVGDRVLIEKYTGTELLDDQSEVYSIVIEDDILGVVNE